MIDSPIEEIKSRLNVTEVLADHIQLKKAGVNYKAVCPFHSEKTPSFVVSPVKQIWHCFGCGLGGDIFEFVKLIENVDFGQALKILANRAGIELKKPTVTELKLKDRKQLLIEINTTACVYFQKVMWESNAGKEALQYLRGRGLSDLTIKKWQLGYAPDNFHYLENFLAKRYSKQDIVDAGLIIKKDDSPRLAGEANGTYFDRFHDRVMFPIVNYFGDVVGFTGRILKPKENTGKYVNSPETEIYSKSRTIYGLYFAKNTIRKERRVIVVEGNMDVITSHQAGFTQTIATSGTAFTPDQLAMLGKITEDLAVVFALDSDNAGAAATQKVLEQALKFGLNVKVAQLGEAKDPDELIKKGINTWNKVIDGSLHYIDYSINELVKAYDPSTPEGVSVLQDRIINLINYVSNPVIRSHFIRKLADKINVSEKSITEVLNNLRRPEIAQIKREDHQKKPRRQILEEQLIGLSINLKTKNYLKDLSPEDFSEDNKELIKLIESKDKLDLDQVKQAAPALASKLDLVTFSAQIDSEQREVDQKTEIASVYNELRKLILKRKMEEVSARMAKAEQSKNSQALRELSAEFTALSSKISKIP